MPRPIILPVNLIAHILVTDRKSVTSNVGFIIVFAVYPFDPTHKADFDHKLIVFQNYADNFEWFLSRQK